MRTRIISAFPGTGKSTYFKEHLETTLDSDSSEFSWVYTCEGEKVRHPHFPNNYISHIKENIGKYEIIFVSTHAEVRKALVENCLFFYLLYPSMSQKEEYIARYKKRGNDEKFIALVAKNWDEWIRELRSFEVGCMNIEMLQPFVDLEIRRIQANHM